MSLRQARAAAVSGLGAASGGLSVVGDNLANNGTTGFKAQRAEFADILGRSLLAGGTPQPGAGCRQGSLQQVFQQGALKNTGRSLDVALGGDGFLIVTGAVGELSGAFYSRAGELEFNSQGYLVNSEGLQVQGYAANPDGTLAASISSLRVPTGNVPPRATTRIEVSANLDAAATPPLAAFDPQTPDFTSNFSTSISVVDSLGNQHPLEIYFRNTGPNTWDWRALAQGAELQGGTPGTNQQVGSGTLAFSTNGNLSSSTTDTAISLAFRGATPGQAITLDFGVPGAGSGASPSTSQFAMASGISSQAQDGVTSGSLMGVNIDDTGRVLASYSNGESLPIGALAIAKFRSNEGLARAGQSLWVATRESGEPAVGTAGSGGRATVSSGALEASNVDMVQQFVDMIRYQVAFNANSRVVVTTQEMGDALSELKR